MSHLIRTFLATFLFLGTAPAVAQADERSALQLRVLYCGNPGSEREADFVKLLSDHDIKVSTGDIRGFDETKVKNFDVAIFDWTLRYDGKGSPDKSKWKVDVQKLTEDFACPAILISAVGLDAAAQSQTKFEKLCLCLTNQAYKPKLEHEVFHRPLNVAPELTQEPTPWDAKYTIVEDAVLGDTISVWKIQTKDYPEIDPGQACDSYGFEDSPDCEIVSLGISDKGLESLAIARQNNFLFWGFSGSPLDMTPSGQRLFINAVAYISKFRNSGKRLTWQARSRLWALRYARTPLFCSDEYAHGLRVQYEAMFAEHPEWIPDEFNRDSTPYIEKLVENNRKGNESLLSVFFPADLREQFGNDASKYEAFYRENLPYLRLIDDKFVVDEDVARLGIANNDTIIIERCIAMLDRPNESEMARRILKRYTTENFDSTAKWQGWFDDNRSQLYFSDIGGFKFFVRSAR